MHLDKFGRKWQFTPGHTPENMLQVSQELAAAAHDYQRQIHGGHTWAELLASGPLEPYLLKSGNGWVFGARYGDDGCEYYSPGFDDRVIALMVEAHMRVSTIGSSEGVAVRILCKD